MKRIKFEVCEKPRNKLIFQVHQSSGAVPASIHNMEWFEIWNNVLVPVSTKIDEDFWNPISNQLDIDKR